jgi:RNA polymerase sigma-70 factor, ECF subfamily
MDIATLIHSTAKGDRNAFTELYRTQQRPMLAYATGILAGDREAAEDAVDEAFLDIWKNAQSYSGAGHAGGWIRRIVRNKAVDGLRKSRGKILVHDETALATQVDPAAGPEDQALLAQEARWLRQSLSKLNVDQREAVILCYYEDRSLSEIAGISNCPENTVKTRLFHARKILSGHMKRETNNVI